MKTNTFSNLLMAAAVAGMLSGTVTAQDKAPAKGGTKKEAKKDGCSGKDGCKGKEAKKTSAKGKDGCSGKDGCKGHDAKKDEMKKEETKKDEAKKGEEKPM